MQVSKEFLDAELDQSRPKTRHYTKYQKKNRRDEVYRLHFEFGYSSRHISDLMKINRHTIDSDIRHHYTKLAKEFNDVDYLGYFQKMLDRLNNQRSRLISTLDKTEDITHKITIERIILEIDSKLTNFILKFNDNYDRNFETVIRTLNNHCEKEKLDVRYQSKAELLKLPIKKHEQVRKIIAETRGY